MADLEIHDFPPDDPSIEVLFSCLNETEVAAVMAERHQALMRRGLPLSTYTNAELIEEAWRFIKLADDIVALEGRWKFPL